MQLHDLMARLDLAVIRLQFYGAVRMELYEALSLLLENRVLLDVALKDMYKIYSENGKKPKRALAAVTYDCYREVADGKPLSKALSKWVPYQEYTLIAAGERSGDLKSSFDNCGKIITAKQDILGAILLATVYPTFLMAMVCVMLVMVSTKLVPKLARLPTPRPGPAPPHSSTTCRSSSSTTVRSPWLGFWCSCSWSSPRCHTCEVDCAYTSTSSHRGQCIECSTARPSCSMSA